MGTLGEQVGLLACRGCQMRRRDAVGWRDHGGRAWGGQQTNVNNAQCGSRVVLQLLLAVGCVIGEFGAGFLILGYLLVSSIHLGCFCTLAGVGWGRKSMTTGSRSPSPLIRQVVAAARARARGRSWAHCARFFIAKKMDINSYHVFTSILLFLGD